MIDRRPDFISDASLSLQADPSALLAYFEHGIRFPNLNMSAEERLQLLTIDDQPAPLRRIELGTKDPTGLLELDDTYEVLAQSLFQECEGIYKQCALNTPSVITQVKKSGGNPQTVSMPVVELGDVYRFQLRRSVVSDAGSPDSSSVQYIFNRADGKPQERGFIVLQNGQGHCVLKNINYDDTDLKDDQNYYRLLRSSKRFIYDYAAALNIPIASLRALSNVAIDTYYTKREAIGRKTAQVAGAAARIGKIIFTKNGSESSKGKPRIAAFLMLSQLLPTSFHTVLAQTEFSSAKAIVKAMEPGKTIHKPSFDSHNYSLPANSSIVKVGGSTVQINYSGDIIPQIHSAPELVNNYDTRSTSAMRPGVVRRFGYLGVYSYPGSDYGLSPGSCRILNDSYQPDTQFEVVNGNSAAGSDLNITITTTEMSICNTGKKGLDNDLLNDVFIKELP